MVARVTPRVLSGVISTRAQNVMYYNGFVEVYKHMRNVIYSGEIMRSICVLTVFFYVYSQTVSVF